jgi:hypothetical protein
LLLERLGNQDVNISMQVSGLAAGSSFSSTAYVRPFIAAPEGVYVQVFDAGGVALNQPVSRIDAGINAAEIDDDAPVGVTPLPGGGFAVHWVIDRDGDGEGDSLAIQRFAADGSKDRAVTVLQGVSDLVKGGEVESLSLAALENGGYALSLAVELESYGHDATLTASAAGQTFTIPLAGRPSELFVSHISGATTLPSFALRGTGADGQPLSVALTLTQGSLKVTQAILDRFAVDNRFTVVVTGMPQGQAIGVHTIVAQDVNYRLDSALHDISRSVTATASGTQGIGLLSATEGRAEVFQVGSATFASGATPAHILLITPVGGGSQLNLAGIPGASLTPTGQVQIVVTPDAQGQVVVPAAILSQLGGLDASISLLILGLEVGSTLAGTVSVRAGTPAPEGVYVHTFGPDGVLLTGNLSLKGGIGADVLVSGPGADTFIYSSAAESTGLNFDQLVGFDFAVDRIDVPGSGPSQIGLASGFALHRASFDADLAAAVNSTLEPHLAMLVIAGDGEFQGRRFLVVDGNGDGIYTAGDDFVFELVNPFAQGNFDIFF